MSSYNYEKALSIEWNGELFILTVRNETSLNTDYLYSYDGNTWKTINDISNIINPFNVKWTGSQFAMLGNTKQGNTILRSNNGLSFAPSSIDTHLNTLYDLEANLEFPHTITFPKNMTLALGGIISDTTKIAYSYDDGKTWTPSSNSDSVFSIQANNAHWNGCQFVAVGSGGNTIATSKNGIQWTGRGSYIFTEKANCILWSREQTQWVAGGSGLHSLAYSGDGIYWFGNETPLLLETLDVAWNGTIWIATGIPISNGNNKSIFYSYDGKKWTAPVQTDLFDIQGLKISWNHRFWTIVGNSSSSNNVATSQDGIQWTMRNDSSLNDLKTMFYHNETMKTFYIKNDSIVLSSNQYNNDISLSSNIQSSNAFIYNGSQYLLGGNTILSSIDGIQWNPTNPVSNMSQINNFTWNHPYLGTPQITPLTIALGEGNNTIAYSEDGIYWKGLGNHIFTNRGNRAVWNGVLWVAVGSGLFWVATSYDGIQWIGRDNLMMNEGYDVAWNGTVFVAVGSGSYNMAVSADGIVWYGIPHANEIFSIRASAITWTGKIWLAYGSGGNTTACSFSDDAWIWQSTNPPNIVNTDSDRYIKPIVTKKNILYQTKTNGSTTYQLADLNGNFIGNSTVDQVLYGNSITSNCFDGYSHIVTADDGTISYISNDSFNTQLNFDTSINGITIQQNITGNVFTSCYNGKRIVLGGTGGNVITYCSQIHNSPDAKFYSSLNANSLFSSVYNVASNSGYGPLFIPNRIYFNPGDKVSIVGPKSYDPTISKNTISMNLYNSNIVQNIQLPTVTVLLGLLGPKGPIGPSDIGSIGDTGSNGTMGPTGYFGNSPTGFQGITGNNGYYGHSGHFGPTGPIGIIGSFGITGSTGNMGAIGMTGYYGVTGPTGPIGKYVWNIDSNENIGTIGNIIIGTNILEGKLTVHGNVRTNGNMNAGSLIISNDLTNKVFDFSGSLFCNQLNIGSVNHEYGINVDGNMNIKKMNINQLFKGIREPEIIDSSYIIIDYNKGEEYYIDNGIQLIQNYDCIVQNLPIDKLPNSQFNIRLINKYTVEKYYCNIITINGVSYNILFNGGNPSSSLSYSNTYIQDFSIICFNSSILKIICNSTNYNL